MSQFQSILLLITFVVLLAYWNKKVAGLTGIIGAILIYYGGKRS